MRSVTSWFNPTLFKKNLKRFWPVWGLYLTIWMFMFPIGLIMDNYSEEYFANREILDFLGNIGLVMALIFSILAAMAVWSYLFNHRSAGLMHQLPIRREGLFLTNYLSGLAFFVIPNAVVFVCTLLAELAVRYVNVENLFLWFVGMTLMEIFFFSFGTFCAMFTGHILALPAFYGILNGLVYGLSMLIDLALSNFVFGYSRVDWIGGVATLLTPVFMFGEVGAQAQLMPDQTYTYHMEGAEVLLIYAALGLILAALALVVYRRRQVEQAGEVVTVKWVRPVFCYGVAFCSALAFGTVMFEIFSGALPETAWTLLFFMMVCGAVGYFIAQMLLEKSFRVFGKWRGCGAFLVVLAALVCVMEFDLTGYESWVPEQGEVASVNLHVNSTSPYDTASQFDISDETDPEVIAAVIAAHQAIVEQGDPGDFQANSEKGQGGYYVQTVGHGGMEVTYTLSDGRTVTRDYLREVPMIAEDLDDPTTVTGKLDALINQPKLVEDSYGLKDIDPDTVVEVSVATVAIEESYYYTENVSLDKGAYERVLQAVLRDMEEGNLGHRYLMDSEERMTNCLVNDLTFMVYHKEEKEGSAGVAYDGEINDISYTSSYTVTLQVTAKHTLAALAQEGVLPGPVYLLTQAQTEEVDGKWAVEEQDWSKIDLNEYAWMVLGE